MAKKKTEFKQISQFSDLSVLTNFEMKFSEKFKELKSRISNNDRELEELKVEFDKALERHILEESEESSIALQEVKTKEMLLLANQNENKALLNKLQEMKSNSMIDKVISAKEQLHKGRKLLQECEKPIWEEYYQLQKQQVKLLCEVVKLRNIYSNEISTYNSILDKNSIKLYKEYYDCNHYGSALTDCGSGYEVPIILPLSNIEQLYHGTIRDSFGRPLYYDYIKECFGGDFNE